MASPAKSNSASKANISGNLQKYGAKNAKLELPILEKIQKTSDVFFYVIGLPDPSLSLGLVAGGHIKIHAKISTKKKPTGELIERMYSPISPPDQLGTFDLQFKVYRKGSNPKYPEGGLMSQYLESKNVGDKITISGPVVGFYYAAPGLFRIATLANIKCKHVGMVCGGTGINVMYPVLKAILNNSHDSTTVTFLYVNSTEGDILMKKELDSLKSDPRVKIHYIVSKAEPGWKGLEGRVTKELLAKLMPPPGKDNFMWVCGPVDMDKAVEKQLFQLKHSKNQLMISSDLGYFMRHILRSMCCCCLV